MTEVKAVPSNANVRETIPGIHFQVAMSNPQTHLFEVTLRVVNYPLTTLDLKMPVWTPGSYLVREYSRHLQDFAATSTSESKYLPWRKISKNHWQVENNDVSDITVIYRIYANDLTVRTNHLDVTHGYFNGAALFFRLPGFEKLPIHVTVVPPASEWIVTTPLPSVLGSDNTFLAVDFDALVDSPFEIGTHELHHFEVLGKPHELAIWGQGNYRAEKIIADIQKVVEVEAKIFGGLPYDRYVFMLYLLTQGYGGLEHKNSTALIYQRFGFRDRDKYERFIQLVAHEFFHLWNVKRIRPQALEVFDYDNENYTASLWFCEGTTSFYDLLIPFRAGIYDTKAFLNHWSKEITRYLTTPGRKVQPLGESSFDAWIKLYRPDANSSNCQISYYLKGEMVTLLLDLLIRSRHANKRSFDDVMQKMWEKFGKEEIGYTPEQLQEIIESVAEVNLSEFFQRYLNTTEELPFNDYLEPFGLQLVAELDAEPFLGVKVSTENGRDIIKTVESSSPAQFAGIDTGDELLAINGIKVTATSLSDRLKDYQAGDTIQLTVFHQDTLVTYPITLDKPRPSKYQLKRLENPTLIQQNNFAGWLNSYLRE